MKREMGKEMKKDRWTNLNNPQRVVKFINKDV